MVAGQLREAQANAVIAWSLRSSRGMNRKNQTGFQSANDSFVCHDFPLLSHTQFFVHATI